MQSDGKRHCSSYKQLQQRRQQEQQDGQLRDWEPVLEQALLSCDPASDTHGHLPRTLYSVSRGTCEAARVTIRHLSLSCYGWWRYEAQRLAAAAGDAVTPAMAAAAAAPPIPCDLLAATPSLTSLEVAGYQLGELVGGGAGAAASAAAASAAAGGPGGGLPSVLATTLGRLRRLRVKGLQGKSQLPHLGRLLAGTTQLTQLVVLWSRPGLAQCACMDCRPLLEEMQAARAAACGGGGAAAMEGGVSAAGWLPPLRHLEVHGPFTGLLPAWLEHPQAAAHLTSLKLTCKARVCQELQGLPNCTGLQELVYDHVVGWSEADRAPIQLPRDLTRLTALTGLELDVSDPHARAVNVPPPVVWELVGLRRLRLSGFQSQHSIPSDISCMQQLQALEVPDNTGLEQLPEDLGVWLPQLEELDVSDTQVPAVPPGLTRLTRLAASGSQITRVSTVAHLVTLKKLLMESSVLSPPLQPLTRLSALETLSLGWESEVLFDDEAEQVCIPAPLPALRSLKLSGWAPRRAEQLAAVINSQQLTNLELRDIDAEPEVVAAVGQLGVLPCLQQLVLDDEASSWVAAVPWLLQQPRLTSLELDGDDMSREELMQLSEQQESDSDAAT